MVGVMTQHFRPLTDDELAQLEDDMADKFQLITELTQELDVMTQHRNAELERRLKNPGVVREFRPRPSKGPEPTDQGSR